MVGIAVAIVLGLVFCLGMAVGSYKASFSYHWGENYYNNMMGVRRDDDRRQALDKDFLNPHGGAGSILKIDVKSLVIKDINGQEKVVNIADDTVIKAGPDTIKLQDLKVDENIVVLGADNAVGQVDAKLIRIMPAQMPIPGPGLLPAQGQEFGQFPGQGRGGMMQRNFVNTPVNQINEVVTPALVPPSTVVSPVVTK